MVSADRLRKALQSGTQVALVVQLLSQLITLAVLAVLYRVLGPRPYGLLGMVMPLFLLLRIVIPGGLDVAAVQREQLDADQVSALFWMNQVLGLVTALLAVLAAPLLVWFYQEPDLFWFTIALSGTSAMVALGTQHQALLQRDLRLAAVTVIRVLAMAIGGLAAITAAWAGAELWTLVVQQYAELLTLAALAWYAEPWRPRWIWFRTGIRPLLRFGGQYSLSNLMFYLTTNVDKILIGRYAGEEALGLYTQAFSLVMKPVHVIITPLTGLMLPALARAAEEPARYRALAMGFFRAIALLMFPAAVGLAVVAWETMAVLGGPTWLPAGPLVAVLALSVLVQGFFNALGSVFASAGQSRRFLYASLLIALAMCAAFVAGLILGEAAGHPLLGVALSYAMSMLLLIFPPYLAFCLHSTGMSLGQWTRTVVPAAAAAVGMGLVVLGWKWLVTSLCTVPTPALWLSSVAIGAAVYILLARREIRWLLNLRRS